MAGIQLTVEADLAAFIDATRRRSWDWSHDDCTMFPANWVRQQTGIDLAETWRGTYSTAEECQALLDSHGGLLSIVCDAMAAHGLRATDAPATGDVGIVEVMAETPEGVKLRRIGAIRQGRLWVCRGIRPAIVAREMPTVMAWRVER